MSPLLSLAWLLRYSNHRGDSLRARKRHHSGGTFYSVTEQAERGDVTLVSKIGKQCKTYWLAAVSVSTVEGASTGAHGSFLQPWPEVPELGRGGMYRPAWRRLSLRLVKW